MSVVARNTVVTIVVELRDAQGGVLQADGGRVTYLHGGYGGVLAAVESALDGRMAGDAVRLHLEPEHAFGEYDAELLRVEPRSPLRRGAGSRHGDRGRFRWRRRAYLLGDRPC